MSLRLRLFIPSAVLATCVAVACSTPPSTGGPSTAPPAATTPAPAALTELTRNLHPLARPEYDVGRRDPSILTAGSIYFKLSAAQKADRDALVAAVETPGSPTFRQWISADEYAARYGATKADVARATQWLEGQGLAIDGLSRLGTRLGFRGTGGQVEAAFHTQIHQYDVLGKRHYAMASAPMVPTELSPVILGLHGFHDFRKTHPKLRRPHPGTTDPIYGETALGPSDFATLYDTTSLSSTTGTGVNLVIIGETFITPDDLSSFRTHFGITGVNQVNVLVPNTGASAVNDQGDLGESELDLEWSSAVAPGANIIFVYTGSDTNNFSVDDSVAYAVEQGTNLVPGVGNGGAQIMSESYGGCDESYVGTDADIDGEIAAAANVEGITYLAASGDSAAAGCLGQGPSALGVGPPSDMPGVTGVGGTEFCGGTFEGQPAGCFYTGETAPNAQASPYFVSQNAAEYPQSGGASLEGAWNDSTIDDGPGGGTGGMSTIWSKPFYQQGVAGMPNDGARDVPDVSLTASANNVPYLVWEPTYLEDGGTADTLGPVGGTSASTPSFAGILARVNQAVAAHGGALGLGNVNPLLYTLYGQNGTLAAFHDIVVGDNIVPCDPTDPNDYPGCPALSDGGTNGSYGGYKAGVGYDLATGLGTIDAAKLLAAFVGLTPTTTVLTAPSTTTASAPVTLSATVTSTSGAATQAVGGTVTFSFHTLAGDAGTPYSFDAGGGDDESWPLGTVTVAAATGSPEHATATLHTTVPPGLYGTAYLTAEYSGDVHYLASVSSPATTISVTGSTLQVSPSSITLPPFGQATFTVQGGAPGVTWGIEGTDGSCLIVQQAMSYPQVYCSQLESVNPISAFYEAGGQAGSVTIVATDTLGEEAIAQITVTGAAVDGGGFPTVDDAGPAGGPGNTAVDASTYEADASAGSSSGGSSSGSSSGTASSGSSSGSSSGAAEEDGGEDGGTGSGGKSSGCSCVVAGSNGGTSDGNRGAGLGGVLLGLAALGRRRSRRG
jgi:subtilase family serine protease